MLFFDKLSINSPRRYFYPNKSLENTANIPSRKTAFSNGIFLTRKARNFWIDIEF